MEPIRDLATDLAAGRVTARDLIEKCLSAIEDPAGEGARAFLNVDGATARATADGFDAIRAAGGTLPPFAGIPLAVKDLFDVQRFPVDDSPYDVAGWTLPFLLGVRRVETMEPPAGELEPVQGVADALRAGRCRGHGGIQPGAAERGEGIDR